jgi:hypothetical protein
MRKLDFFWASNADWWHWEGLKRVLNDDAPPEAKESYQNYLKQLKSKSV